MKVFFFLFLFTAANALIAQSEAESILDKSIQYHDPGNNWSTGVFHFPLYEGRANGNYRLTDIIFNNGKQHFEMKQIRGKERIYRLQNPSNCVTEWNHNPSIDPEIAKRYRLDCDGGNAFIRDYYGYLYGLPMKLKDPGTIIDPEVKQKDFFGKKLLEIRVTYRAEVGNDIWYFYFDPTTFALSGYRFYHDEAKNDGEYILLDGEITINGVKFPQKRAWYTHKDGEYLGNDDLLEYSATTFNK